MRCGFGGKNSQSVNLVYLAQDCLEMRLDGFAEWGKPYGWAAIEQGTAERHSLLQVGSWT